MPLRRNALALLLGLGSIAPSSAETPAAVTEFTKAYCVQCHGADKQKGDFRIDTLPWNLTATTSREQWELVHEYLTDGDMPPKKAEKHPPVGDRKAFLAALDSAFSAANKKAQPGGTPLASAQPHRVSQHGA